MYFKVKLLLAILARAACVSCVEDRERPTLETSDGNLILRAGLNKNITLRTNGRFSNININDKNLIHLITTGDRLPGFSSRPSLTSPDAGYTDLLRNLMRRVATLEVQSNASNNDTIPHSNLRIAPLRRRVFALERQVRILNNLLVRNECKSNPCKNGGTCFDMFNGFLCTCPSNWEGPTCRLDVNECSRYDGTDLGCQHGTCVNKQGSYECVCSTGWFGVHCSRKTLDCTSSDLETCGHGTCISTNTGIKCLCNEGWRTNGLSVTCNEDVDECSAGRKPCSVNPSVECINLPGAFKCGSCPPGYTGDGFTCADVDECVRDNGGCSKNPQVLCMNTMGSRICGPCPPGHEGDGTFCIWRGSCAVQHGGCHPSAKCVENTAISMQFTQCICPEGMEGDGVGLRGCYVARRPEWIPYCASNPCQHGACYTVPRGFTCVCNDGYIGAMCDRVQNNCSENPCKNGGVCKHDNSTKSGYHCECSAQYTGQTCQTRAKACGGILDNSEGSIVYPLYNSSIYNHNARCAWIIQTSSDKVLNVTFTKFNLEHSSECGFDWLQIHDGRSSANRLIGRFCGNNFPNGGTIISTHNSLYLWFSSDQTVAKGGFTLHWRSVDPECGGELNIDGHGQISSPGSPGTYPPNRDCYWALTAPAGKRIQIHFFLLQMEAHLNCSFDYLEIFDGTQLTDPLLFKYCNSSQPPPLLSPGPELLIHFHSDAYNTDRGFQLSYAVANGVPGCGGLYTAAKGEITPPTLGGSYVSSVTCDYKIDLVPGSFIKIHFLQFDLEYSNQCQSDSITIYDGDTSDAKLIGTFCGSTMPADFISSTNKLLIIFKSDWSIAGNFKLSYEIYCELSFTDLSGVIQSPGYPAPYPGERECHYRIMVPAGNVVKLEFSDFDIETGVDECLFDILEIKDGENKNAKSLGKFCGDLEEKPPTLLSTHNYLYLIFTTDNSITGTGFSANYTAINVGCGGIYTARHGIITHPTTNVTDSSLLSDANANCSWILSAPHASFIQLSWNVFALPVSSTCLLTFIEILEIDTENLNEHSLGKFCGRSLPPAITSVGSKMKIRFQSNWKYDSDTFTFTYMFANSEGSCGGRYLRTHGNITSPGFPKRYGNSKDCTWIITVPYGQQIMLKVLNFSTERSLHACSADFLEIRNGGYDRAPLIGKFCGNNIPKLIPSIGNALYLHFKSDSTVSGKGFQVEWKGTTTGCGGTVTSSSGSIISPNYPRPYGQNTECYWRIATSAGSGIQITFGDVDLEPSGICMYDFIEIYDGRNALSPKLGRFCTLQDLPNQLTSSSNHVYIRFRSDISVEGNGFSLNYQTVCNRELTGFDGVIESLDFPNQYPNRANCTWTVKAPLGNRINVTFSAFQVEAMNGIRTFQASRSNRLFKKNQCKHDSVTLKDGTERSTPLRYCGSVLPPKFTTRDNTLQVHFESDLFITYSGFRLEWVVDGCGGHLKQFLGSLTTPSVVNGNIVCEWLIETEPGTSVEIRVVTAHMKPTVNCTQDALSVYNGLNKDAVRILHICHSPDNPVIVTSNSNYMFVRFSTESGYTHSKLVGTYRTISPATCGGTHQAHSGVITSPNYPKNYNLQSNCFWTIRVPTSYLIQLNFKDWDIGSRSKCRDSLKIYDGVDPANPQNDTVVTYCGNQTPKNYVSKNNEIKLEFRTSSMWTAKGFKIEYSIACGANIKAAKDGILTSLSALTSLDSRLCNWTISAPRFDQRVSLTFTYLDIPAQAGLFSCLNNSILVYDGVSADAPLMGTYCGSKIPPTIVSRGSALTFVLSSSTSRHIGKFSAHYTVLDTACGGNLEALLGTIASPSYPDNYPMNTDCIWTLKTSPGNTILIDFRNFNLLSSENCNEDYLEIRENDGIGKLLGLYCDDKIPSTLKISEPVYIKFRSGDGNSAPGFTLDYVYQISNDFSGNKSGKISSPLYPKYRIRIGEYTWRIMTQARTRIMITIDTLYLENLRDSCENKLALYDGYDNTAPLLVDLCASLNSEKVLFTMSNLVFVKFSMVDDLSEGMFSLNWTEAEFSTVKSDKTPACSGEGPRYINRSDVFILRSPGFPKKYNDSLQCEWIYETDESSHLYLKFDEIDLEETDTCYADKILLHSFNKETDEWEQLGNPICLANSVEFTNLTATNLMKVSFQSDSYVSKAGFSARIHSICGGALTQKSGVIEFSPPLPVRILSNQPRQCEWTVKVGSGQMIQVEFAEFNITNDNKDTCDNYLVLKNGVSKNSPNLGKGKYCLNKELERNEPLVTLGNMLYVKLAAPNFYQHLGKLRENLGLKLRYFEKKNICGSNRVLDAETQSLNISSPNYPNIPHAYTECVWTIMAPPGEIIRFEIIERFDMTTSSECNKEFVEIRDGGTENSPWLATYCSNKHPMLRTTDNMIYVKFVTSIDDPRNGFKANISIDTCGGTFSSSADTISSPGYPLHMILPEGTVCEWRIIVPSGFSVWVTVQNIDLPKSEDGCATFIKMEDVVHGNNTRNTLAKLCDSAELRQKEIRSSLNEVVITLVVGKRRYMGMTITPKGFQITYNTTRAVCGGEIKAASGTIMSPEYPNGVNRYVFCNWHITAPKGRRITLRFEDVDLDIVEGGRINNQRMGIYNDHHYISLIKNLSNGPSKTSSELESSGNLMMIFFWNKYASTKRGFKATFTSDKPTYCVGSLNEDSGSIISNNQTNGYYCEWERKISPNVDSEFNNITFVITITNMTVVNATTVIKCLEHYTSLYIIGGRPVTLHTFCSSFDKKVVRLPTNDVKVKVTQTAMSKLDFYLDYSIQPCGGQINLSDNDVYLKFPSNHTGSLDCMWFMKGSRDNKVTITIEGDFTSTDNTAEFLNIYKSYPNIIIGEYYKDRLPSEPISTNFAEVYVEYHAESFNSETKLKVKLTAASNACGGTLNHMARTFHSPDFPKHYTNDQECIWDIQTLQGYRVSLSFVTRFYIEETVNCTKDFVEVFDFISDNYKSLGRFCGRTLPGKLMSTNNKFRVMFRSDSTVSSDGFQAIWQPTCGGTFKAVQERQWIMSPGWPASYQSMLDCVYNITSPEAKTIDVAFDSFSLESGTAGGRCKFDNLTMTGSDWSLLGVGPPVTVCGTDLQQRQYKFKSAVKIQFQTDRWVAKKGFRFSFSYDDCISVITSPGQFSSPKEINNEYQRNLNCLWNITAPVDKVIVLKFNYFDTEHDVQCSRDYLSIFDGLTTDENHRLALLCGSHNYSLPVIRSTTNQMTVQFVTDFFVGQYGFEAEIMFTYGESVGCGGNYIVSEQKDFRSPRSGILYKPFLDCHWLLQAPEGMILNMTFKALHIMPCYNINQTAMAPNNCSCDYLEVRDGASPVGFLIGRYCGHSLPHFVISTGKSLYARFVTDGTIESSGFEASLTAQYSDCGPEVINVTNVAQNIRSQKGQVLKRGTHCKYFIITDNTAEFIHVQVKSVDMSPASTLDNNCHKDKLQIFKDVINTTYGFGKDLVMSSRREQAPYLLVPSLRYYTLCGKSLPFDFYAYGALTLTLITSPEEVDQSYSGFDIDVKLLNGCNRNFTQSQGRILLNYDYNTDCYQYIKAPEHHTISLYFISFAYGMGDCSNYLEVHDGKDEKAKSLRKLCTDYSPDPIFSSGRYLTLHGHSDSAFFAGYDLNFATTDKGQGCGGELYNEIGAVTSPLYPQAYRENAVCVWTLYTVQGSKLHLEFEYFDLGSRLTCGNNYLELVDKEEKVLRTYCANDKPANYNSPDNYVKLVFHTSRNNGGQGWHAKFKTLIDASQKALEFS